MSPAVASGFVVPHIPSAASRSEATASMDGAAALIATALPRRTDDLQTKTAGLSARRSLPSDRVFSLCLAGAGQALRLGVMVLQHR